MRRKEREITDPARLHEVIEKCKVCRLAMYDGEKPYIVPMNFGYDFEDGLRLYFHCAREGKKLDILKENPEVCFEMDCEGSVIEGENDNEWSFAYASVIGNGKIRILPDEEKNYALSKIMEHFTGRTEFEFDRAAAERTALLELTADGYTGKQHLKK